MALIDASTSRRSPLAMLAQPDVDEQELPGADEPDESAELPEHEGQSTEERLVENIDNTNLARDLAQDLLDKIGMLVCREYDIDNISRSDWRDKAEQAQRFAKQDAEPKQYPFPSASNVIFPAITTAAIQFAARTYPAVIKNRNVVKGVVWGSDKGTPATVDGKQGGQPKMAPGGQPAWLVAPGEKRKRADKIAEHMSWQLLEEMPEWEPQTDQLLHQLPIIGGAIRKTFRDPALDRNFSLYVSLLDLVWNYHAPSFEAAPRHTEVLQYYPHEIREFENADQMFIPLQYGPAGGDTENPEAAQAGDDSAPHEFLEQHRRYDLDGDGYPEPYIVTVHKRSAKVVRLIARYDEDSIEADKAGNILRIKPVDQYTLIPFLPSLDGGSYPIGFGHLLRSLNEAINTSINQMFDAGHLQNAGGGFVSDQLGIKSGEVAFRVGRYVRVNSKGMDIRQSVFPIPFQGPSPVLFQLLGMLVGAAKEVASTQDILTGDAALANTPPTTMVALVEQGLKVYTAIHKRVFRALKSEYAKLYRLNRLYLTEEKGYRVGDEWREITPDDYRLGGGVEPIGDPTMVTDMQRLARSMVVAQFKDDPLLNKQEIYQRLFEAASIDRIDELFAPPNPAAPMLAQLALQQQTAELGRTRAAQQKDETQAFLNLALARAKASGPEVEWIDAQLRLLQMRIEAVNTMVKAADVQGKHGTNMSEERSAARQNAETPAIAGPGSTTPTPRAVSPLAPAPAAPGMEAPPDNGGLPEIPPGPVGSVPPGGPGPMGGG